MKLSVDGVAVTVTTAVPLHAASADSAKPSGAASTFKRNLRMAVLFSDFRRLKSGKQVKICEVAIIKADSSQSGDNQAFYKAPALNIPRALPETAPRARQERLSGAAVSHPGELSWPPLFASWRDDNLAWPT